MNDVSTIKTEYFKKPWTWVSRALRFLMAILVLYLVDLYELAPGSNALIGGYIFVGILAVFFLLWPTDELELDKNHLSFIKKSLLPIANKTTRYKLSELKRIGSYNISKPAGILALLVPVFNIHRVEIIFKDDSLKSHDLIIHKKQLHNILLKVKASILSSAG
jgi:hypothetical protein